MKVKNRYPKHYKRIKAGCEKNMTNVAIAKQIGTTHQYVSQIIKQFGLTRSIPKI